MSTRRSPESSGVFENSQDPEAPAGALNVFGLRIATVILAAGESRRLGRAKTLLGWGSQTLLEHIVGQAMASSSSDLYVVLGAHRDRIEINCDLRGSRIVVNEEWREGMTSSIRAALRAIEKGAHSVEAVLFLLGDQPAITPAFLNSLRGSFGKNGCDRVASFYSGRIGIPAIFDRSWFPALKALKDDRGVQSLLRDGQGRCCIRPFPGGEIDINTQEDYERVRPEGILTPS
jgi:molybdenum cofactor cytidylyltransferase